MTFCSVAAIWAARLPILCAVLFALLGGCLSEPSPSDVRLDPAAECTFMPRSQTAEIEVGIGMMRLLNPLNQSAEGSGGGRYFDFILLGNESELVWAKVIATWDTPTAGQDRMSMEIDDDDDSEPSWHFLTAEGPSPLSIELNETNAHRMPGIVRVIIKPPSTPPAGTVTTARQTIFLELQTRYKCVTQES